MGKISDKIKVIWKDHIILMEFHGKKVSKLRINTKTGY
jgi:hypothetical protein